MATKGIAKLHRKKHVYKSGCNKEEGSNAETLVLSFHKQFNKVLTHTLEVLSKVIKYGNMGNWKKIVPIYIFLYI